ncbi:MAG: N-acetyltransferase [Pseudomonadota bacterium]
MPPDLILRSELPADGNHVEALYARAFGPGRHARSAYRMRGASLDDKGVAVVAERKGLVIGAIRQTAVLVGGQRGYLLGPLAVAETAAKQGIGRALMHRSLAAARERGASGIVLVGDLPFYAAFGFVSAQYAVRLPWPFEAHRLLVLPFQGEMDGPVEVFDWVNESARTRDRG